jgi:hypothetical protein
VGIVVRLLLPLPVFYSPKAMVLLVPSVMLRMPMAPPTWKTPLGGPPTRLLALLETHSRPAPYSRTR